MRRLIFVNTSGWLALYNKHDPNHASARALWESLRSEPVRFATTDYVLDQVFTTLKIHGSLHAAQAFHQIVYDSQIVRLFMVDSVIFDRAWRIFESNDQPHWTFTDCINYAVIQYTGASEVFTFDPGFTTPEMRVVPGGA